MLARLKIDTGIAKLSSHTSPADHSVGLGVSSMLTSRMRSISNASSISSGSLITPASSSTNASTSSLALARDPTVGLTTPASLAFDDTIQASSEFVLSLHDYEPAHESATCLSFKAGQVIRVYNRDTSGWWDGELDGRRGWFPSNFVCSQNDSLTQEKPPGARKRHKHSLSTNSVTSWAGSFRSTQDNTQPDETVLDPLEPDGDSYCHPLMVPLLHALSLLQSAIRADRRTHYSPSTACVISCVRAVLKATESLERDAHILQQFEPLAEVRKEMLETLAFLVGQAKAASTDNVPEDVHRAAVHGMLRFGGQIFECVRRFLTVAMECGIELPERRPQDDQAHAEAVSAAANALPIAYTRSDSPPLAQTTPPLRVQRTKSMGNLRRSQDSESSVPLLPGRTRQGPNALAQQYMSHRRASSSKHNNATSISSSGSSMSSIESPIPTPSPPSFPVGPASAVQVLDALRSTHDEYLSTIAAFIGFAHSYSRLSHASSTGHMYELVRDVVDRVCKLLSIVEAVIGHPDIAENKIPRLRLAKDSLYNVTSTLAGSVRFLNPAPYSSPSVLTEEDERQTLISSATSALRAGADCVAAIKMCLIRLASEPRGTPFRIEVPSGVVTPAAQTRYLASLSQPPVSPRKSISMGALKQPSFNGPASDEEVTIQVQTPTPMRPPRPVSSDSIRTDGSKLSRSSSTYRSMETVLTSPDEAKTFAPLVVTIPSAVEPPLLSPSLRTDDGTTWEGSIQSPMEAKIFGGELPSLPTEDPEPLQDPSTWAFSHDYSLDDVAYNSEGHLVGATIDVLVEKLTPHDNIVDPAFCAVFFMTFRMYSSPLELMDTVITRYNLAPPSALAADAIPYWQHQKGLPVRLRVSNLLKMWLETFWRPGLDDEALDVIHSFTQEGLVALFPKPAQRILELVELRRQSSEQMISPKGERIRDPGMSINPPTPLTMTGSPSEIPRPSMTKALLNSLRSKNFGSIHITDFDALELARQLTIMECNLYCAINPQEILETGDSKKPSVSIKAMSTLSTTVTGWVAEGILNEPDTKKRTTLVKFFIKVADRCTSLQNFSTPRSILAALDSSTISRLHQTWNNVPLKNKMQMENLRRLADHSRNYHEYRSKLRNTAPPAVPFLGLYLTDVTFCREGNPTHRASPVNPNKKLLNFNKYHKLARIVQDMQRFQVPYTLKAIPEVRAYLDEAFRKSEHHGDLHDLYRRSLLVEPKQLADVPPQGVDVTRQLFGWVNRDRSHSQAQAPV